MNNIVFQNQGIEPHPAILRIAVHLHTTPKLSIIIKHDTGPDPAPIDWKSIMLPITPVVHKADDPI